MPRSLWLRAVILVVALVVIPYVFSRALSPWRRVSMHALNGERTDAQTHDRVIWNSLRIVSYNIAHGRGTVASNWEGGDRRQRLARLDGIAKLLTEQNADIVVLNEVDFDSSWSNSTNQAQYLAEKAGYPFWVEQRNLDFRILLWKWRFGNAVLSKHPIETANVVQLPSYSGWETLLAGKKRGVVCDVRFGKQVVRVIGAHLSHRSERVRVLSAKQLAAIAMESTQPLIIAGDLNSTPSGFPVSGRDANGENAIDVFDSSGAFLRSPDDPPKSADMLTFSSTEPRSIIDWIMIPRDWSFMHYEVLSSELSDHRPILAEVSLEQQETK